MLGSRLGGQNEVLGAGPGEPACNLLPHSTEPTGDQYRAAGVPRLFRERAPPQAPTAGTVAPQGHHAFLSRLRDRRGEAPLDQTVEARRKVNHGTLKLGVFLPGGGGKAPKASLARIDRKIVVEDLGSLLCEDPAGHDEPCTGKSLESMQRREQAGRRSVVSIATGAPENQDAAE